MDLPLTGENIFFKIIDVVILKIKIKIKFSEKKTFYLNYDGKKGENYFNHFFATLESRNLLNDSASSFSWFSKHKNT